MGLINQPNNVKYFSGIIASNASLMKDAENALETAFGKIDCKSGIIPFDFTGYYKEEMGDGLLRQWVSFEKTAGPGGLAAMKIKTNTIEQQFAVGGKRPVNLDPGYLALSKLILASTKDFSHRIYLADGISAEITLLYKDKHFVPLEWTYPDYNSSFAKDFFIKIRQVYFAQLK